MRAVTGAIPRYADLAEQAAARRRRVAGVAGARRIPRRAIDTFEHDLAVLLPLLKDRHRKASEGRAHYLLELNEPLRRSVTARWARWQPRWHTSDGIVRVTPDTAARARRAAPGRAPLLALGAAALLVLPVPVPALGDLPPRAARGAGAAAAARSADARQPLPRRAGRVPARAAAERPAAGGRRQAHRGARRRSTWAIARVTADERDKLAPAIERVWHDEIAAMTRDLHRWLEDLARGRPHLGAGALRARVRPAARRRSATRRRTSEPALVDGRFLLRGSIDLVERKPRTTSCASPTTRPARTARRSPPSSAAASVLQPVLYGLALESLLGRRRRGGPPVLLHHGRRLRRASRFRSTR